MCGRYSALTGEDIQKTRDTLKNLSLSLSLEIGGGNLQMRGDGQDEVFPTNQAPIIIKSGGGISFEQAKWGFGKPDKPGVIINARSETIKTKTTFAGLLNFGRCIVPARKFFEWERIGTVRKKYSAEDGGGKILFMAGLFRTGSSDLENEGREFVIITKESTGEMQKIHSRMPVILRADQVEAWLSGKMDPEDLGTLDYCVSVTPSGDAEKNNKNNINDINDRDDGGQLSFF